jgi:hypothetical protein
MVESPRKDDSNKSSERERSIQPSSPKLEENNMMKLDLLTSNQAPSERQSSSVD